MQETISEVDKNVEKILKDPNYCPCLLLGHYVTAFRKLFKGDIFHVSNVDEVREFVERFMGVESLGGKYLVLDGIGFLNDSAQSSLLKFIEESSLPIILLSYFDKVSPIILSRMRFVFKDSVAKVSHLQFMSLRDAYSMLDTKKSTDSEFNYMDEVKFYADSCPSALVLNQLPKVSNYSTSRMIKLISKL